MVSNRAGGAWLVCVCVGFFGLQASAYAQTGLQAATGSRSVAGALSGAYTLGAGDILEITVADSPEISGKYRISETGGLSLPQLPDPVQAAGTTAAELSRKITEALKKAEILREPVVNVFVQEYHSKTVMVLGAVSKPGVYALEKPTTLLEVLSLAGGLAPTAGGTLTVAHNSAAAFDNQILKTDSVPIDSRNAEKIDLSKLIAGKDFSLNVYAQPGDVMIVGNAPVVYVVGAVVKPGGFPIQDSSSGITVLQALALVEGFAPAASPKRAIIVRRSADSKDREEIHVNLTAMMTGKLRDRPLEGNDILFIPTSSFKKGVKTAGNAAVQAAINAAGYGAGLRIGPP